MNTLPVHTNHIDGMISSDDGLESEYHWIETFACPETLQSVSSVSIFPELFDISDHCCIVIVAHTSDPSERYGELPL